MKYDKNSHSAVPSRTPAHPKQTVPDTNPLNYSAINPFTEFGITPKVVVLGRLQIAATHQFQKIQARNPNKHGAKPSLILGYRRFPLCKKCFADFFPMNTQENKPITPSETTAQCGRPVSSINHAEGAAKKGILSLEEWKALYRPVKNPFDEDSYFDGILFRQTAPEREILLQWPLGKIWTLTEIFGFNVVCSGFCSDPVHGYLVTEVAYPSTHMVLVELPDEMEGAAND